MPPCRTLFFRKLLVNLALLTTTLPALSFAVTGLAQQLPNPRDDRVDMAGLDYLSNTIFPSGYRPEDTNAKGWLVAGLSGIDFNPQSGLFTVVRDNVMSGAVPGGSPYPNVMYLKPTLSEGRGYGLEFSGGTLLAGTDPAIDSPESVRYDSNGSGLWFTNENSGSLFHWHQDQSRREIALPEIARGAAGSNRGLEGLTLTPAGAIWVGAENNLPGDAWNISRLTQVDREGKILRQLAYRLDNRRGNGLSEILAIDDASMLVMERAFDGTSATAEPRGESHNSIRIYRVDVASGTDIQDKQTISDDVDVLEKTLIFDSASLDDVLNTYMTKVDNIEGMSFGPRLPNGHASLVLVSDDNGNRYGQGKTQFIVFAANSPTPDIQYWDGDGTHMAEGAVGGDGTWQVSQAEGEILENWAREGGWINDAWGGGQAVFAGSPGTVTLDTANGEIAPSGLNFMVDGYRVTGDALTLKPGGIAFRVSAEERVEATIASALTGAGGLDKRGLGTLILTGDSDYSGATTVGTGTLRVNGTIKSAVSVADGARLAGTGTVGTVTLASGGKLAPGNSVGTLSVAGDLTFAAGSIYDVEVNAQGESDRTDVSGRATIGENVTMAITPEDRDEDGATYNTLTRYTVLNAKGGITGQFATVEDSFALLDATLEQTADQVMLTLKRSPLANDNDFLHFSDLAHTPNQRAVARSVELLGDGNSLYDAVLYLPDGAPATAFDQLSGELYPAVANILNDRAHQARSALNNRLRSLKGTGTGIDTTSGQPPPGAVATGWFEVMGQHGDYDGDANGHGVSISRSRGIFVGLDGEAFSDWHLGVAAGYNGEDLSLNGLDASSSVDSYHLGAYAGTRQGSVDFNLGVLHSWHEIDSERTIAFPRYADHLEADYAAGTTQLFAEAAINLDAGPARWQPYVGLARVDFDVDGIDENGGSAALSGDELNEQMVYASTGLRLSSNIALGDRAATLTAGFGWQHALDEARLTQSMSFDGGDTFKVFSADIGRNSLELELSTSMALSERTRLGLGYNGRFADDYRDQSVNAKFEVKF